MNNERTKKEVWFITGSQDLYGEETLRQVAANSRQVVESLNASGRLPVNLVFKPIVTTPDAITRVCREANLSPECIGIVCWMHTFSPAKMWIAGLTSLSKPMAHLHTQFNRDLPWSSIDMDFMNLNQSAHGDREFGFICSRLRVPRKVIVGHYLDDDPQDRLSAWMRAALACDELRNLRVARIGDNMRHVAVTEGDKVEAQIRFGVEVHGYGVGDVVDRVAQVADADVDRLTAEYDDLYDVADVMKPGGVRREALRSAARTELGLRALLEEVGARAMTDTFEDLHGLDQLPGFAAQRLMADGYGFGAEGDWKTAALVRAMKVMTDGLEGGTSFMEDYTYHLAQESPSVLGAHMLEVCPTLTGARPSCEIHPLGIGGKDDPVRLVFMASTGPALNVAMLDLGDRFRMLVNAVDAIDPGETLPNLPVARAVWKPLPDLKTAAAAWIYAGGPHHTVYSQSATREHLEDFTRMLGVECLYIDEQTRIGDFNDAIRWNDAYYSG